MYTKEDAERDLLDAYYRLHLDELLGLKPEVANITTFEKTDHPSYSFGIRDGVLVVGMWAPDYWIGMQYVAAQLAVAEGLSNKQGPWFSHFNLFVLGMLAIPYIFFFVGILLIQRGLVFLGLVEGLFGEILYICGTISMVQRLREMRKRFIEVTMELNLGHSQRQAHDYTKDSPHDLWLCSLCGGINFMIFHLIFLAVLVLLATQGSLFQYFDFSLWQF